MYRPFLIAMKLSVILMLLYFIQKANGIGKKKEVVFKTCKRKSFFFSASYGLSFQEDGYMNDNSVETWARLKTPLPELTTFSICSWVKFTYEVSRITT